MTTNPPQDLGTELEDIKRRLRALETAPRASDTSVFGGSTRWLDDDGNIIVELGQLLGSSTYGLTVYSGASGQVLLQIDNVTGTAWPGMLLTLAPSPAGGGTFSTARPVVETSSASYVETYRADFDCTGAKIDYDFSVEPLGAGTVDWRLQVYEFGATPATAASGTGVATYTQIFNTATIPTAGLLPDTGDDPVGRSMTMRLEVRRGSGTGAVYAAPNSPVRIWGAA